MDFLTLLQDISEYRFVKTKFFVFPYLMNADLCWQNVQNVVARVRFLKA